MFQGGVLSLEQHKQCVRSKVWLMKNLIIYMALINLDWKLKKLVAAEVLN